MTGAGRLGVQLRNAPLADGMSVMYRNSNLRVGCREFRQRVA
jgi:hypothetical protein